VFQILHDVNIDFMGKRRTWVVVSAVVVALAALLLATRGLEYGIEFSGGSEVQVRYAERPDVGEIRSLLDGAGFSGALVTTIGAPEDNEVYVRLPLTGSGEEQGDLTPRVIDALRTDELRQMIASGLLNVNTAETEALESLLSTADGVTAESARSLAEAILELRSETALFSSVDELASVPGMTEEALAVLKARGFAGPFAVRSQSYIGPVIGKELVQKAVWAILGSLAGMLIYIWIRFEFQWGLAAVIALVHDTILTLGLFSIFGYEMSLPVVAAFLTLIGYSVNDTVVVFDRVRENLRTRTGPTDFVALLNHSINQTLSRTVITSGLTWMVCVALFALGGETLRAFSFVLATGIIVGTYSSIYVASPVLVYWRQWVASRKSDPRKSAGETARPSARKIRPSEKA
jgi:preprotein translocase subunit SecF